MHGTQPGPAAGSAHPAAIVRHHAIVVLRNAPPLTRVVRRFLNWGVAQHCCCSSSSNIRQACQPSGKQRRHQTFRCATHAPQTKAAVWLRCTTLQQSLLQDAVWTSILHAFTGALRDAAHQTDLVDLNTLARQATIGPCTTQQVDTCCAREAVS